MRNLPKAAFKTLEGGPSRKQVQSLALGRVSGGVWAWREGCSGAREPPSTPTPRSLSAQEGLPPGCWAPGLGLGSEAQGPPFQAHAWSPHCSREALRWVDGGTCALGVYRYVHNQNTFLYLECLCSGYRERFFFPSP